MFLSRFLKSRVASKKIQKRRVQYARLGVEMLDDRIVPNAVHFTPNSNPVWSNPNSWWDDTINAKRVPGTGDDVTIGGYTVTVNQAVSINSLALTGSTLNTAGGNYYNITLANGGNWGSTNSVDIGTATFTQAGGTLTLNGTNTIVGPTSGTAGLFSVSSGANVSLSGTFNVKNDFYNGGTITFSTYGHLKLGQNGRSNNITLTNASTGTIRSVGESSIEPINTAADVIVLDNSGMIEHGYNCGASPGSGPILTITAHVYNYADAYIYEKTGFIYFNKYYGMGSSDSIVNNAAGGYIVVDGSYYTNDSGMKFAADDSPGSGTGSSTVKGLYNAGNLNFKQNFYLSSPQNRNVVLQGNIENTGSTSYVKFVNSNGQLNVLYNNHDVISFRDHATYMFTVNHNISHCDVWTSGKFDCGEASSPTTNLYCQEIGTTAPATAYIFIADDNYGNGALNLMNDFGSKASTNGFERWNINNQNVAGTDFYMILF